MRLRTLFSVLLPFAAVLFVVPSGHAAGSAVVHCPQLLDVEAGKLLGEHTILVEGERIASVEKGFVEAGDDASEVVRLDGHTCLPGLIDSHRSEEHTSELQSRG